MIVRRKHAAEFPAREIEPVTTFARQSALALEKPTCFARSRTRPGNWERFRATSPSSWPACPTSCAPLNAIMDLRGSPDPDLGPGTGRLTAEFFNILTSGKHLCASSTMSWTSKIEAGKMELPQSR
jgi:hypothetical protein